MIKDDAKFFFCLSGFAGFIIFFLFSTFLQKDTITALVYGTAGCLIFSIFGRFLLGFALNGIMKAPNTELKDSLSPEATDRSRQVKAPANPSKKINQKVKNSTNKSLANSGLSS